MPMAVYSHCGNSV